VNTETWIGARWRVAASSPPLPQEAMGVTNYDDSVMLLLSTQHQSMFLLTQCERVVCVEKNPVKTQDSWNSYRLTRKTQHLGKVNRTKDFLAMNPAASSSSSKSSLDDYVFHTFRSFLQVIVQGRRAQRPSSQQKDDKFAPEPSTWVQMAHLNSS